MTRNIEKLHVFIALSFFFILFMISRRRENFTTCGMAPINTDSATTITTALMVDEQGNPVSQVPVQVAPEQAINTGTDLMTESIQSSVGVEAGPGAPIEVSNNIAAPDQNPTADEDSTFTWDSGEDMQAGGPTLDNGQLVMPQSLAQNAALQSEDPATKTQDSANWMTGGVPMF